MKPVIAMPLPGRSLFRRYMTSKYILSLWRSGAKVRIIPLENPEKAVARMLTCDGLLLPGGTDINPQLYGQIRTEKCQAPNTLRDTGEWQMLDAFLSTGKPILGICRGIQLMNVYFGGTLHQDIRHLQQTNHDDFSGRGKGVHPVTFKPGTLLHHILGTQQELVNTMHHQALDRLGKGLICVAVSDDGFAEAVELSNHPFCLGVQWHPEHMSRKFPSQQRIFDAFVSSCGTAPETQ